MISNPFEMQKLFGLLVIYFIFIGCNDGDRIDTTFDFENETLQVCEGNETLVFFIINDAGNESISFVTPNITNSFTETSTVLVTLNGTTTYVNYRIFNGEVTSNYFCADVPPTNPIVTSEYLGNSGEAQFTVKTTYDDDDGIPFEDEIPNGFPNPNEDEDNDGILNYLDSTLSAGFTDSNEDGINDAYDTDLDGLLNYFDMDDDGDNVPTIIELDTVNADGDNDPLTNPMDTDKDGIPNYLDPDDDDDGVLTRDEDINSNLDPTDDISANGNVPNYLDNLLSKKIIIKAYREHLFNFTTDVDLEINNLILQNGDEQRIYETFNFGAIENILSGSITTTPQF